MRNLLAPCLAELIGVFFLTFLGGGAICVNELLPPEQKFGLIGIALAHGLALSVGVSASMNVSGGQLNPAVTITMWVYGRMETWKAVYYILFQLLGALLAGALLALIFGWSEATTQAALGTPHVGLHKLFAVLGWREYMMAIAIEIVLTALLMASIFGTAVDPRAPKIGGFGIGLTVMVDILVGGPLTGAAMNPARAFGTAIWEAAIKQGMDTLADHFVYWVGPIIGGILAGGIYINYILPEEAT
ncbi:MAG: aquaporin [Gemmatales bacterium]|nr:aquaporin [Gemmatales bacterium]MDW8174522.1 aquaporin [Gemmatales bacterium]